MNPVVMQIEYNALFIRPVAWFMKEHVNATINEFRLTQLYAEFEEMDKKGVPLPPRRSTLDVTE